MSNAMQPKTLLQDVIQMMELIAPLTLADTSFDNVGTLVEAPSRSGHTNVMVCIDLTTEVLNEAIAKDTIGVIITYHPLIFRGLKSITNRDPQQASIIRCIVNGISIYCPHTSLDCAVGGINDWLASIGLPEAITQNHNYMQVAAVHSVVQRNHHDQDNQNKQDAMVVIIEKPRTPVGNSPPIVYSNVEQRSFESIADLQNLHYDQTNAGMGRTARHIPPLPFEKFTQLVMDKLRVKHVQMAAPNQGDVGAVAYCAGSGSSILMPLVYSKSVDTIVTGELMHHDILAAYARGIRVILTNHSNSERRYMREVLVPRLDAMLSTVDKHIRVCASQADKDPLELVVSGGWVINIGKAVNHISKGAPVEEWDFKFHLIYKFLRSVVGGPYDYTVEEAQRMTGTSIPSPPWVRVAKDTIPWENLGPAASYIEKYLGPEKCAKVGDQWKENATVKPLVGEWVAMQKDWKTIEKASAKKQQKYEEREQRKSRTMKIHEMEEDNDKSPVVLYLHGGAYYICSLDTHRMMMWRLAKKIGGRVFSPDYRLAPQNQFPSGLQDCLAAYLYLIQPPEGARHRPINPNKIVIAGDSSGGGMTLALLLVLRECGLPMPAGAMPISPWVDLTHSLPSCFDLDTVVDYVPEDGFRHRPSAAWPSPADDPAAREPVPPFEELMDAPYGSDARLQFYAPNDQLQWDLVSPMSAELGGLPPMFIISGGAERLRDENLYVAHKMANPDKYRFKIPGQEAPKKTYSAPTSVHLQVYDGMPHVFPMFGVTKPVTVSFRAMSRFIKRVTNPHRAREEEAHFYRERINTHGEVRPMEPEEEIDVLQYAEPCQFQFDVLTKRLSQLRAVKKKKLGDKKYERYHTHGYNETKDMLRQGSFGRTFSFASMSSSPSSSPKESRRPTLEYDSKTEKRELKKEYKDEKKTLRHERDMERRTLKNASKLEKKESKRDYKHEKKEAKRDYKLDKKQAEAAHHERVEDREDSKDHMDNAEEKKETVAAGLNILNKAVEA